MSEKRLLSETGQRQEEALSLAIAAITKQRNKAVEDLKRGISKDSDFRKAIGYLLEENLKAQKYLERAMYELTTGRKWGGKR